MVDKVIVFTGSKKDFEALLSEQIDSSENTATFLEIIQEYNRRLKASGTQNNESPVADNSLLRRIKVDNCVVRTDDYGSVLGHVVSNFAQTISLNYDIRKLYIQNPPKRVLESLKTFIPNIEYLKSSYTTLTRDILKEVYASLNENVLGQNNCKRQIVSNIYRLTAQNTKKPVVIMLYGPSGVGKTESAKVISKSLGGRLLRIQFSMMQTVEAYNYVFGGEHSKSSFARDMIARETNVILIDEFDKVSSSFYNAFYELFDEGKYVDMNYEVELSEAIFICTCNFMSENEIKKALGPAMFSRIGGCVKFEEIDIESKRTIINNTYNEIIGKLREDEKVIIESSNILNWFLENAARYDNIRIMKTKLENAIFEKLTDRFIITSDT